MRSRSLAMRMVDTIWRRSTATGWRVAMVEMAFSSMLCCRRSMAASPAITCWASWTSPANSAFAASASEASARCAMSPTSSSNASRSAS